MSRAANALVVLMAGWPASGKTTTAGRLHAALGGALIRSCDVYAELGISLPDWVRRTDGLTRDVEGYDALRDRAYDVMAERLAGSLDAGASLVVVDAVHGERDKRRRVVALCRQRGAFPLLLLCRCDDPREVERRLAARRGREAMPEHEASDAAVVRYIVDRWDDPRSDADAPPIAEYDTTTGTLVVSAGSAGAPHARALAAALVPYAPGNERAGRGAAAHERALRDVVRLDPSGAG